MRFMHKPSDTFLRLINEAGGIAAASGAYGIPQPTLYGIRNGSRRIGRAVAETLERATEGRYLAADLLGLTTTTEKAA